MIELLVAPEREPRVAQDVVIGQRATAVGKLAAGGAWLTARGLGEHRWWCAALLSALVAVVAAVVVPFAPVIQDRVRVSWPAAGSDPSQRAAAIPLMPYQPVQLTARVACGGASDIVLLSTVPLRPSPGVPPLSGLRVERDEGELVVQSYGREVARTVQPAGACLLEVRSDPARTSVILNGRRIGELSGDVRPVVAGAFTEAPSTAGLGLRLVTDTRFQTSMTVLKAILVALSGLGLLGALLIVAGLDDRSGWTRRAPVLAARWWLPRLVDAVVCGGLALWAVVGPINLDDGYISGIVRTREVNGYVGNLHRWLNAPEAPFGWFYELLSWWSRISAVPVWMRIPSTVLGVVCWLLLSRALLPRLGGFAARPATVWVAAAAFGLWWLPFNLTLRSEPWIAVAGLITLLAVERALITRRLVPVLLAVVVAAAATAVAPTGIVAFAPLLVGLVPLLRALRRRPDVPRLTLLVLVIAAASSALLLAFADQTMASVMEATRVRYRIGGGLPWFQEFQRYTSLLMPGSIEGPLQRRVPVLLTLLGLAGIAWAARRRHVTGFAGGAVVRVGMTLALSLVAMSFVPTKWTSHFGALAGVGSAVLVIAWSAWGRQALQEHSAAARSLAATAIGTVSLAIVGGTALAGFNQWPYISNYGITWGTMAPRVGGIAVSTLVLGGGLLLAAMGAGLAAWVLAGGRSTPIAGWLPSPGLLALILVVVTLALQLGTVARAGLRERHSYSMAADSIAVLSHLNTGEPSCGMADHLQVETNPQAGLLPRAGLDSGTLHEVVPASLDPSGDHPAHVALGDAAVVTADTVGAIPLGSGDVALPGWVVANFGPPVRGSTPWYRLDTQARRLGAPVVITISGDLLPGDILTAEFGRSHDGPARLTPLDKIPLADPPGAPAARDIRMIVPDPAADLIRLSVTAQRALGTIPLALSAPRSPRTTPMTAVLPLGTEAVADWPVAFLFPCLRIAGTPDGTAALPRWRVATPAPDTAGDIITTPRTGGPFATPRALVQATRIPVYLNADPLRDVLTLYHWQPLGAFGRPDISRDTETVNGWQHPGHLHAPDAERLDQ